MALPRQIFAFGAVGLAAAVAHYGLLIALVQLFRAPVVPATLCGYLAGGVVSYLLNRGVTFESERVHREAVWRFVVVAAVGFVLTALLMTLFVNRWDLPYLPAQLVTTGIVVFWSFTAHRFWTFPGMAPP